MYKLKLNMSFSFLRAECRRYRSCPAFPIASSDIDSDPERTTAPVAARRAILLSGHFLFFVHVFPGTDPTGGRGSCRAVGKSFEPSSARQEPRPPGKVAFRDLVAVSRAMFFVDRQSRKRAQKTRSGRIVVQRSKPQPNSGKPCRMLVSPLGRTASEFIDQRLAMPIDEF